MCTNTDEMHSFNSSVRTIELKKSSNENCGFHLTRSKWDPYPWVCKIENDSIAYVAGLRTGDCLLEVNGEDIVGKKICEVAELVKSKSSAADNVSLLVWNAGVDQHCSSDALCCGPMPNNLTRLSACMAATVNVLECPVCLETISPPTYQCTNGHLICIRCKSKAVRCPVCRIRLNEIRSLVSDQIYNSIVETFNLKKSNNGNLTMKKIQEFFKIKKTINIPNITVTSCDQFMAKLTGKSSSVDNLSLNDGFLSPSLEMKSLSSSEICQNQMSRKIERNRKNETNSLSGDTRSVSCHGSMEHLTRNNTETSINTSDDYFYCPFQSNCQALIKGMNFTQHFKQCHVGALTQYFGNSIKIQLMKLDTENCFMINYTDCIFFIKILADLENSNSLETKHDLTVWCWYSGSEHRFKNYEIKLEMATQLNTFLRVRSPIFSLKTKSFSDLKQCENGIFVNSKLLRDLDKVYLKIYILSQNE